MTPEKIAKDLARYNKIKAEIEQKRLQHLGTLQQIEKYRLENKIEFFTPYTGVVDPDKKLIYPQQNPKQQTVIKEWENPERRIFVLSGGNRSTKTSTCVILAFSVLFGCYPWEGKPGDWRSKRRMNLGHKMPRKIRIIGQDWRNHIGTVIVPAMEYWWPATRKRHTKKNNEGIEYFWRDTASESTIEVMSNHQESDVFEGWEGDLIYPDEPLKRDIYIASKRGLIDRTFPGCLSGRVLMGMTLLKEPWIDKEILKRKMPDGSADGSIFHLHLSMRDNIGFGITRQGVEEYIKDLRANGKEEEVLSRVDGVPSYLSGLVLKFDSSRHCVERFKIPTDWIVDIAIDVHPKKPQAVLFNATSPQNMKYYCWEIWEHGDARFVADEIIRVVRKEAYRVGRVIIDPLAKSDSNSENSFFDIVKTRLAAHGMYLETASKDKTSGIIEMNSNFQTPNGMPCQYLFSDLKRTIHDFEGWVYEEKGEEAGKPKKEDDDMCENAYRLALLGTQWTPPQAWVSDEVPEDRNASAVTGY